MVAKGFKSGGKNVKKGQVLNPKGRPKLPEHVLTLKKDASLQAQLDIIKVWNMTQNEMFEMERDNSVPAGLKSLVACLNNCIQVGSTKDLNLFLDRIIGKVTEAMEISGPNGEPIETKSTDAAEEILRILKSKSDEKR